MKTFKFELIQIIAIIFWLSISVSGQVDMEDIVFGKHRVVKSEILGEDRLLYVHLPDGYEESNQSYPVIFQLYSHFKYNYYLPAIRASNFMQVHGEAPGVIVVGVKNLEFRYRDLLSVDHNQTKSEIDKFLRFFEEELLPFVHKNYRSNGYNILSGPQAGAAFGIYSLAKKPDLFNAYFLTSPFWISKARTSLLATLEKGLDQNDYDNKFLMVTYKDKLGADEMKYLDSLSRAVRRNSSIEYVLNPIDANSFFTTPVDIMTGMKTLFQEYKFPGTEVPKQLEDIEKYYDQLSLKYNYEVQIPEHSLVFEGDKFMSLKSFENAKKIFQKMLELYPKSAMAFDRLGRIAFNQGDYVSAIKHFNDFLICIPNSPYGESWIEKIKREILYPSLHKYMKHFIDQYGVEEGMKELEDILTDRKEDYLINEDELNGLGYSLLSQSETAAAIEVFVLYTLTYPNSSNAFDSLGEAYMENGDVENAILNYSKSLLLNPKNTNATERISKLRNKE